MSSFQRARFAVIKTQGKMKTVYSHGSFSAKQISNNIGHKSGLSVMQTFGLRGKINAGISEPRQKRMAAPFDEKEKIFTDRLEDQFARGSELKNLIREILKGIGV